MCSRVFLYPDVVVAFGQRSVVAGPCGPLMLIGDMVQNTGPQRLKAFHRDISGIIRKMVQQVVQQSIYQ